MPAPDPRVVLLRPRGRGALLRRAAGPRPPFAPGAFPRPRDVLSPLPAAGAHRRCVAPRLRRADAARPLQPAVWFLRLADGVLPRLASELQPPPAAYALPATAMTAPALRRSCGRSARPPRARPSIECRGVASSANRRIGAWQWPRAPDGCATALRHRAPEPKCRGSEKPDRLGRDCVRAPEMIQIRTGNIRC